MDGLVKGSGHWGGLAAIVGGLGALLFTPVFALAYLDPAEESPTFLIDAIRTAMNPPLGFASVDTVYRTFGLWYIVATTLMFVGFVALRAHLRPLLAGRGSRWLMITSIGWGMLLVGLVGNYGIGEALSSGIHMLAFLVEMVGGLLLLLGLLMVGIGLQRSTTIPVWISWSLIAVLPLGIAGVIPLGHLPSGPMLGLNIAWLIVGFGLWREHLAFDRVKTTPAT
jgi:hypothetical protein